MLLPGIKNDCMNIHSPPIKAPKAKKNPMNNQTLATKSEEIQSQANRTQ